LPVDAGAFGTDTPPSPKTRMLLLPLIVLPLPPPPLPFPLPPPLPLPLLPEPQLPLHAVAAGRYDQLLLLLEADKGGIPGVGDCAASMRFTTVGTTDPPGIVVYPAYTVACPGKGEQPSPVNQPLYWG
jgi:hypothetical protein